MNIIESLESDVIVKNYFDVVYETQFPVANFYVDNFKSFPSSYSFSEQQFKKSVLDTIAALPNFEVIYRKNGDRRVFETPCEVVYLNETNQIVICATEYGSKEMETFSVRMFHPAAFDIQPILKEINVPKNRIPKKGNITLIRSGAYGLDTVDFELKSEIKSLKSCYGEGFLKVHDRILSALNEQKSKGIVLLHGEPGTGKSYYLKHLSTLLKKKVLWLPQTAADSLCNPEFITFLMDNMNSVLIIEDGERVIKDRDNSGGSSANAVSNLLNLTDGILSDCLHIQEVATFNTDIKNIDKALMRKGRLIVDYEFGKLSVDDSNSLLKEIGVDHVTNEEMTLADIYNFNQVDLSNHKKKNKIGFSK